MDYMIWLVAIALLGYVVYTAMTAPPSSGCLSADLARARDEAKQRAALRDKQSSSPAAPDSVSARDDVHGVSHRVPDQAASASADDNNPGASGASNVSDPAAAVGDSLRNPDTGEQAAVPTNYRFAKRWVKEAMVTEGLLEKVYANAEIDAELAEKLRSALAAFKSLDKYRA